MCITEYNEVKTLADERMEGRAEGRAESRAEGGFAMLVSLVRKGLLSEDRAASEANMSVSEFKQKADLVTI